MIRFYAPSLPDSLTLPESDSGHAVRVLRLKEGDAIEAVDGRGMLYKCVITDAHPKHTGVHIESSVEVVKEWPQHITLAIAPTKNNDRMEWLVEKLVEIGIDRIVPLRCMRSERKDINVDRLERVAVAAMKQSLKAVLPEIQPTRTFKQFIAECSSAQRFIAYCDSAFERRLMAHEYHPYNDTSILIGPEGDFSPEEISTALSSGWTPVSLGETRLRTETAALVAVETCHVIDQLFPFD